MVELIDDCVGCVDMGLPCRGICCPYSRKYYVYYCDECGMKMDGLEDFGCRHICDNCLEKEEREDD